MTANPPAELRLSAPRTTAEGLLLIDADVDGAGVGHISWDPESGTVDDIAVDVNHRRRGIATALWHAAAEVTAHLRHDGEEITDDGRAFARTIPAPWNTGAPPPHGTC